MPARGFTGTARAAEPRKATDRLRDAARVTQRTTRAQVLGRTAAALTEHAPSRTDSSAGDDPWDDVPEELEPIDEDALEAEDFVYTEQQRRGRPAIAFHHAPRWTAPSHASAADPGALAGDLRITVRDPVALSPDDDVATLELVRDELMRIGVALERLQGRALLADSRPDAVLRLTAMTQKKLAEEAAVSTSVLSRRRREIVEAPWGLVPLEFFWWLGQPGLDADEAQALIRELRSNPTAKALAIAQRVAQRCTAPARSELRADAIRRQVPVMRALLPLMPTLVALSDSLTRVPLSDLEETVEQAVFDRTGQRLSKRGRGLVRLALAGAFSNDWESL